MNLTMEMFCELPVTDIGHVMRVIKVAKDVEEHLRDLRRRKQEYHLRRKKS